MAEGINPLIAALRAGRESWAPVAPGKEVKIVRPPESEFHHFIQRTGEGKINVNAQLGQVQQYVADWRGFTEADLLGATVGNSDPLPFDAAIWREVIADRMDWMQPVATALVDAIIKHLGAKATDAGNSPATLTPGPAATVAAVQTPATTPTTPSA